MGEGLERERKAALRGATRAARAELTPEDRRSRSAHAVTRLGQLPEVRRARSVALYAANDVEVDVTALVPTLVDRGVITSFPRVVGDDLELVAASDVSRLVVGYRGLSEPTGPAIDPEVVDVIVVPGVAFDPTGGRVGQGGGHYDRLLARLSASAVRIGVGFSCQVVPRVPREAHDQPVDLVVTERATYRAPSRSGAP